MLHEFKKEIKGSKSVAEICDELERLRHENARLRGVVKRLEAENQQLLENRFPMLYPEAAASQIKKAQEAAKQLVTIQDRSDIPSAFTKAREVEENMTREDIAKSGVFGNEEYWEWVTTRKVTDNPRGDFIEDTISAWRATKGDADEMAAKFWSGSHEAKTEGYKLARQFLKQKDAG